jgi:hypothetical protein
VQTHSPAPPTLDAMLEEQIVDRMVSGLSQFFPEVIDLPRVAKEVVVGGGWIVAHGKGALSDPASTLHRRDEFGISSNDNYYSVDIGKYSVAPWLASQVADELIPLN